MISAQEYEARREAVINALAPAELDALLVGHLPNIRYLTGFTGSNALLLITRLDAFLFTDPRYDIQSRRETTCRVTIARHPILAAMAKRVTRMRYRSIGIDPAHTTVNTHAYLKDKLPKIEFKHVSDLIEALRMVKSDAEITMIRRSVATNSKALAMALKRFKPAMTEADLAAEIDYQMRRLGAEGPSFETIVATGARAALPHARPSSAPIESNRLLLIDMGATQDGYTSDMTRTVSVGNTPAQWRRNYHAVLEAQLAAIDAVRPGVPASRPDKAARQVLEGYGLEKTFTHSTGHGLGLEIHEAPRLGKKEKMKLRAGMVITIEPGIYLENEGGIRIEDTVLVTPTGCEILTPTSKDLAVL